MYIFVQTYIYIYIYIYIDGRALIRGPLGGGVFQELLNLKLLVLMPAPPIYICASVITREEVEEGSEGNHSWHSSFESTLNRKHITAHF